MGVADELGAGSSEDVGGRSEDEGGAELLGGAEDGAGASEVEGSSEVEGGREEDGVSDEVEGGGLGLWVVEGLSELGATLDGAAVDASTASDPGLEEEVKLIIELPSVPAPSADDAVPEEDGVVAIAEELVTECKRSVATSMLK